LHYGQVLLQQINARRGKISRGNTDQQEVKDADHQGREEAQFVLLNVAQ
jgi:hypothetical protein